MSRWLDQQQVAPRAAGSSVGFGSGRQRVLLRSWDVLVAAGLGLLLCLPYACARLLAARVPAQSPANDEQGVRRHRLELPPTFLGRLLAGLGAASWPVVLDVLAGRLSWVGPTSLANLPRAAALAGVRPGVVTLWGLRQRTAVAYLSEVECDHEYLALRGVSHDLGLFFRSCLLAPLRVKGEVSEGSRVCIGDVTFDNLSMQAALARLDVALSGPGCMQVSFVNPACVNIAAGDRAYRRVLKRAELVLPDGIGIKIGADILGTPLKQNVNGTDLFPRLCALMERRQSRLFLLGGQPGVPDAVAEQIRKRWPGLRIVGHAHGFFSVADEGRIVAQVKASGADVVLVARGVPAQDVFIDRYLPQFGARVVMGVGGLFDFVAGRINRAPQWMRDSGLEWVYRLMQEPGRMWRRYLLGNFSFLARVVLQRIGWRKPANDLVATPDARPVAAGGPVQAVLFACAPTDTSIPSARDAPASLLPLGCASFLERALEHLSEAGVHKVHLVVSHQPESLRRVVGMGERWGLAVQWHLARDDARPYGALSSIDWNGVERVLVGHAERWVGRQAVCELAQRHAVAWVDDPTPQTWSGWASTTPAALAAWPATASWEELSAHLHADTTDQPLLCASARTAWAGHASDLLAAQMAVFEPDPELAPARQLPGSWIKTPWGGMSPSARVHPQAIIQGPVLLGPGCLVDAQARIGPDVVLVRDVVVTRGSSVADAVVLANTFIGEGLSVTGAVVDGTRLHQLDLGVTIELPAADGLLMALRPTRQLPAPGLASRGFAALGWALLLLPATLDAAWRSVQGLPPRAARVPVALGHADPMGVPAVAELWMPQASGRRSLAAHWLSLFHPLADVVRGRRTWLGRRLLSPAQWALLSDDWRQVLSTQSIGVLHAPAWIDAVDAQEADTAGQAPLNAAEVAADVFLAVQSDASLRRRMLFRQLMARGPDANGLVANVAKVPPTWQPEPMPAPAEASRSEAAALKPALSQPARMGS